MRGKGEIIMKIEAETKYNIGQTVYYVLPSRVTNEDYDAFIYELEILDSGINFR